MTDHRLTGEFAAHAVPQQGAVTIAKLERTPRRVRRAQLPEWRRPYGALMANVAETERTGLREALFDLAGRVALTEDELRDGVLEDWGDATPADIRARLHELVRAGALVRSADGYVRWEP